ncbi:MAG TPA: branched-chain amino acid ABC transporter permease [Xanthobacteraceae bacterium]|nr:branched-chain amino acid ABC transporter permease [Xanthobacteraceae bacterium]
MSAARVVPVIARSAGTPVVLIALVGLVTILGWYILPVARQFALTEMLVMVVIAVGISIFTSNTGIISFGHIGFVCIGAYATAWMTCDPMWKRMMLHDLPWFLADEKYPPILAIVLSGGWAAAIAGIVGAAILRLSGIAAAIATFAFLMIVSSVYSNWNDLTAGTSSIINVPTFVTPPVAAGFAAAAIVIGCLFRVSRAGLMLRASSDDMVAAQASAIPVVRLRLAAFVLSAFVAGCGGAIYAHFVGILSPDNFYLNMTFVTLAMVVIGGINSLSGAVVGVIIVTLVIQALRQLEAGVPIASGVKLPNGSQEVGLAIAWIAFLIFRPRGIMGGTELGLPQRLWKRTKPPAVELSTTNTT